MDRYSYVFVRVVLGLVFLAAGWGKHTMGIAAVTSMFAGFNVPFASILAPIVIYGEILAGIALILGVYTHFAAKFTAFVMLGAIIFVHFAQGFMGPNGYAFPLALLAMSLLVMSHGDGVCNFANILKRR